MNLKINLFLFFLIVIYVNCEKTCVFNGHCGTSDTGFPTPCARETEPEAFKNKESLNIFKKFCPELDKELKDELFCCDDQQIHDMVRQMELMSGFEKCPSCFNDFKQVFCKLTCSPNQNKFLKVTKKSVSTIDKKLFQVDAIKYGINYNQVGIFYNACENAVSTELNNMKFFDLFGSPSDPFHLFKGVGQNTPFTTNFNFFKSEKEAYAFNDNDELVSIIPDIGYESFDFKDCDELSRDKKCLCTQCKKLKCPLVPELEDPKNCQIFVFDCTTVIVIICYLILLVITVIYFSKFFAEENKNDRESNSILDRPSKDEENFQTRLEKRFGIFFENWTRICVRNPYYVIFIGFITVIILSSGLSKINVVSDPVELWSSSKSLSRQQREFYNENFKPFYRIQQVIIRKTDADQSTVTGENLNFSSLFDFEFLSEAFNLFDQIINLKVEDNGKVIKLSDVCYQPLNEGKCLMQSPFAWFQEDKNNFQKETYLSKIENCLSNFQKDLTCFGTYGGPVYPYIALGGYDKQNYNNSQSLIINILGVNNLDPKENLKALAWEKKFINFMAEYEKNLNASLKMDISYFSERSVEDELERQSISEIGTVAISYFIMFIYVAISLRPLIGKNRFFIDSRIGLAIVGVLIVLASVSSSIGLLCFCGFKVTLIIVEVIPFLVLAVGVDNIFIIVQSLDSEKSLEGENLEDHISRVMSKVGPSLLLAFSSEVTCFFLGTLSSMPCIRIFALNAALALIIDFIMQITVFLAILSLDCKRKEEDRYDILICMQAKKTNDFSEEKPTLLYRFFNNIYSPFLMKNNVRAIVLIVFSLFFCISLINVKKIEVGLNQEISMPKDSYVYKLFLTQKTQLRVGPPVYFVVKNSVDLSLLENRNFITENNDYSLVFLANVKSKQEKSYIASQVASWVDNYDAWIGNQDCFQVFKKNNTFCSNTVEDRDNNCFRNLDLMDITNSNLIKSKYYYNYIEDFLNDAPNQVCPFGGKAQFKDSVKIEKKNNATRVITFNLMAYHSVLKNSKEFVAGLEDAKLTSNFIQTQVNNKLNSPNHLEIFPYSIFYVYYEQFLTIWKDTIFSLSLSVFSIFLVSLIFLGFDLRNVTITVFTIISILLNVMNVMYWWNISLNAVSLVNLVMSVGISVEFCSHILHYFSTHSHLSPKQRAQNALGQMGISIYTGITLTKFVGIVVLANSKSQIFQIFYFRMYMTIVLIGSSHGLILLPVLLSIFGKK